MIGSISGVVQYKGGNYLIIQTGGVGYKIFSIPTIIALAKVNSDMLLFIHTYVREDQISLYGFSKVEELEFFELLLTVSGVGPKSALGIMSLSEINMLKSAIASGDPSVFTKVAGIGRKTAERVIVELKEKLKFETAMFPIAAEHNDALEALEALGFSQQEAREALKDVKPEMSIQEKVKSALKKIGR
jgi:Holliday junction DNA helicase RuvA